MSNRRLYLLDILAIFFGISAWISINGLWVELPLMVQVLPEGWSLASYLSVIIQIANAGPILYTIVRWATSGKLKQSYAIYFLFVIGILSSVLLASFWDQTTVVLEANRSTALFVLVFCLSLVDCTSSVLFLPFMATFRETYLNSYLIGEGLSGFVPAIAALIQGVGGNPTCRNVTQTDEDGNVSYITEVYTPPPRFSIEAFFYFLFVMMVASFVAFILLNVLQSVKREHATIERSALVRIESQQRRYENYDPIILQPIEEKTTITNSKFYILLLIQAYVCFLSNGAFPSIQTYSCMPYGNTVYHLSATLNAMANPVMAFVAFFIPCRKLSWILVITALGSILSAYLLATALYSPDMLWGQNVGGTLTVISWTVYSGLFSYVKVSVAGLCRQRSEVSLFWCGALTQVGSAFGALLMFLLVNIAQNVFVAYYVQC